MANHRNIEGEDQEPLYQSFPCTLYYVQSPSTASHANSTSDFYRHHASDSSLLSPPSSHGANRNHEATAPSRFALSPYSSRGSNNSFLHEKKIAYDLSSHDEGAPPKSRPRRLHIVGSDGEGGHDGGGDWKRAGPWRFISLNRSSSCFCIGFQLVWRFMLSLGIAVLVFFLLTKPPPPKLAFKMVAFRKFNLKEGLDNTGVVTKILSCNSSIDMEIENNSKVFGLYVHNPTTEIAFGRLKFGSSQGHKSYVPSYGSLTLRLYVGAMNIPVYGAGQDMQDILESGQGLPLAIRVKSRTSYHIVWKFLTMKYHHHGQCLLVLYDNYDEKSNTHIYKGSCFTTISHA